MLCMFCVLHFILMVIIIEYANDIEDKKNTCGRYFTNYTLLFMHTCKHTHSCTLVRQSTPDAPRYEFKAVAEYDYSGLKKEEIPLTKGEWVTIIDDSREH